MTRADYFEFTKCTRHTTWLMPFVHSSIWREYLWDFLVYPHEHNSKDKKKYNKCLKTLPKLEYFVGPRIIFTSATKSDINNKRVVKLIYKLYHSIKNPNARILIIEYVLIEQDCNTTWKYLTDKAHDVYAGRLQ